jgi:hypothetical protein
MTHWTRGSLAGIDYGKASVPLVRLVPGDSLLRVHYGIKMDGFWTAGGLPATESALKAAMTNATSFGIVTVIGSGSEVPPSPVTHPGDVAPPTQRWVHLATSSPSLTSFSGTSSTWTMGFSASWEDNDSESQVLATGFTAPNALDVWLSIDTQGGPWSTPSGTDLAWYSVWWSVLAKL